MGGSSLPSEQTCLGKQKGSCTDRGHQLAVGGRACDPLDDLLLGQDLGNNAKIGTGDDHDIKSWRLFKRIIRHESKPITGLERDACLSNGLDEKGVILSSIPTEQNFVQITPAIAGMVKHLR